MTLTRLGAPTPRTTSLLAQAEADEPGKLDLVQRAGAKLLQFRDPDDFALVYTAGPRPKALIVNWQGHRDEITGGGWPADGVGRWIPHLRSMLGHGLSVAVAALQTHDGAGTYLTLAQVQERMALLRSMLRAQSTPIIYHGFSKGGTIAYRLAFDNLPPIAGVVADSVAYAPTLADNAPIEAAAANTLPLMGRRVVMTSGAGDTGRGSSPDAMRTSLEVVTVMGASTLLLTGGTGAPTDHGFFLGSNNTAQVEQAVRFILGVS